MANNLVGRRIGKKRIELVDLIGEGSYGSVYRGILRDGSQCAVKCMDRFGLDAYRLMIHRRETMLHKKVSDGEGVVSLYETFEEDNYQFLVMEFCPGGDLWEAIAAGKYTERDDLIRDVFTQILRAVEYCHSKRVFHRDLKPENVLLAEGGRKVLLADFGLASGSPLSNEMRCGSPWYMSPECWGVDKPERIYPTAPNDVWALGVLFINLSCGRHAPWKQATSHDIFFRDFLKQPNVLRVLLPLTPDAHDLLARVFVVNPAERIGLRDFRLAVQGIKQFAIPLAERAEFRKKQRAAWSAMVAPSPGRPLSIETLRLIPVASQSRQEQPISDDESIDITDAAKSFFKPYVLSCTATGLRSGADSDSEGPITPDMPPTIVGLEDVPDIVQDLSEALEEFTDLGAGVCLDHKKFRGGGPVPSRAIIVAF